MENPKKRARANSAGDVHPAKDEEKEVAAHNANPTSHLTKRDQVTALVKNLSHEAQTQILVEAAIKNQQVLDSIEGQVHLAQNQILDFTQDAMAVEREYTQRGCGIDIFKPILAITRQINDDSSHWTKRNAVLAIYRIMTSALEHAQAEWDYLNHQYSKASKEFLGLVKKLNDEDLDYIRSMKAYEFGPRFEQHETWMEQFHSSVTMALDMVGDHSLEFSEAFELIQLGGEVEPKEETMVAGDGFEDH